MDSIQMSKVFNALSDPKRIAILELLKTGEKCSCRISDNLGMAQSALSYHIKILCSAGLIECKSVGKWTHHSISKSGGKMLGEYIASIFCKDATVGEDSIVCR